MIPGFIQVDSRRFYLEAWPQIKRAARENHMLKEGAKPDDDYAVVTQSNWHEVKASSKAGAHAPALLIHWGYKDTINADKVVLAVTRATQGNPEEHWVAPHLIDG